MTTQRRSTERHADRLFELTPLATLLVLAFGAPLAFAQDAGAPAAGVLPTVTVTAERRTENIKDVPSSISTLSGEKLDVLNSGGEDVRALSGRVPSLNIESSFGRAFPRFYIRGYGNTDFRVNASQPVSLVYDDVVQENPLLKGFPIFDLVDVEHRKALEDRVLLDDVVVDQRDGLRRVEVEVRVAVAPDVEARERAAERRFDVQAGHAPRDRAHVFAGRVDDVELLAAEGRDGAGHIADVLGAAFCRDRDGRQRARGRGVLRRSERRTERDDEQGRKRRQCEQSISGTFSRAALSGHRALRG